jgi:hypothetical protein
MSLIGGEVSLFDFLNPFCYIVVELRLRHVIDVVVPIVVNDVCYCRARFDEIIWQAPYVEKSAIDDLAPQIWAHEHHAEINGVQNRSEFGQ